MRTAHCRSSLNVDRQRTVKTICLGPLPPKGTIAVMLWPLQGLCIVHLQDKLCETRYREVFLSQGTEDAEA